MDEMLTVEKIQGSNPMDMLTKMDQFKRNYIVN